MNYILKAFVKDIKEQYNIDAFDDKLMIKCCPKDYDDDSNDIVDNAFYCLNWIMWAILENQRINEHHCGRHYPDLYGRFNNKEDYSKFKAELQRLKLI